MTEPLWQTTLVLLSCKALVAFYHFVGPTIKTIEQQYNRMPHLRPRFFTVVFQANGLGTGMFLFLTDETNDAFVYAFVHAIENVYKPEDPLRSSNRLLEICSRSIGQWRTSH